jgi:hypothetical protein
MITNYFLNNMANAITSNTFVTPGYLGVGTTVVSDIAAGDVSLSGEIGSRVAITKAVAGNTATYSGIRTPASVVTTSTGDTISSLGLLSATSGNNLLQGITMAGLTHTTTFQIEYDVDVVIERR